MRLFKMRFNGYPKSMSALMATLFVMSMLAFAGTGQHGALQAGNLPSAEDPEGFRVTLIVTPEGAGEVEGGGRYMQGDEVTVEAEANEGYQFLHWTDDERGVVVSSDEEYEFTMPDQEITLTAHFVEFIE